MHHYLRSLKLFVFLLSALVSCQVACASQQSDIADLRTEWAVAKFQTPKNQQLKVFENLITKAESVSRAYPNNPEAMTWHATILSTYASIKGGLGVLKHVKQAKELLESAIKINSRVENGFAHGVLGALYARVPGWPVAFGSNAKAEQHFLIALQIDPKGSDSNFYYGDFLVEEGKYQQGLNYLNKALKAPVRKDYAIQDRGRKNEILSSINKARQHLR